MGFCDVFSTCVFCWWFRIPGWQRTCIVIGVVCASLAFVISVYHFVRHMYSGANQALRKITLVIVFMVPLYSLSSIQCLIDARSKYNIPELLEVCRGFYEAVVILAFTELLLVCLLGSENVANQFAEIMQKPETPFLKCIPTPFRPGVPYVAAVLAGILQFVCVSLTTTVIELCIWLCAEVFGFSRAAHTAIKLGPEAVKGLSVSFAMYCITIFYFEIERNVVLSKLFAGIKYAEVKFMCIKGVIMLTILQNFICRALAKFHHFHKVPLAGPHDLDEDGGERFDPEDVGVFIQSFACCCELLVFAILQVFAYPVAEFSNTTIPEKRIGFRSMYSDMQLLRSRSIIQSQMVQRLILADQLEDEDLVNVFDAFDVDFNGKLSMEEFVYILEAASFSAASIAELSVRSDANSDGTVTFAEFKHAFGTYQVSKLKVATITANGMLRKKTKEIELMETPLSSVQDNRSESFDNPHFW